MPSQFEDTHIDISGDEQITRPLSPRQMQGAIKRGVNRTQQGPQVKSKNGSGGGGPSAAGPDPTQQQAEGDQQAQSQQQPEGATQPPTGLGPAWQALTGGIGDILKDPEWMQHPLLRLFADPTSDPNQMGQDLWGATQWWGRVLNAAFDVNAIHASMQNIADDNSIKGQIAHNFFGINNSPGGKFGMEVMPYVLAGMAEWEPWMWGPAMAAQGPGQLSQLPQMVMGLVGQDIHHPQFQDPQWYARMGSYVLAAVIAGKTGGKALSFTGRLKILEPFAAKADRYLGGPGDKTPSKGPDGQMYDPDKDPNGHAHANWWNTYVAPVEETTSAIGKPAAKQETALVSHPDIEGAYQEVPTDPTAKTDFANLLGIDPTLSKQELHDKFFAMLEGRQVSPQLSQKIIANWERFGPTMGMKGNIKYWHPGEADLRNVGQTLKTIPDEELRAKAASATRAAAGLVADLGKGIHGYGNDLTEALVKGITSHGRASNYYATRLAAAMRQVLPTAEARSRISAAIEEPNQLLADRSQELARLHRLYSGGTEAEKISALRKINELEDQDLSQVGHPLYDSLDPHEQWAVDLYRRLAGELRTAKFASGRQLEAQPNFFYRVPKRIANLEAILKGIPEEIKQQAGAARKRTPFGYVSKQHRATQLTLSPSGELQAEPAYATTKAANAQRAMWREQIKADLVARAAKSPALQKIVSDPAKLEALAHAEIPDFSTDIIDSFVGSGDRGLMPDMRALYTHQVMESAKRTLVKHSDGEWHPLAVAKSETGQESSPTLSGHFKHLHSADTTTDFYSAQGWRQISGFGAGHIFHPSFADPLNTALDFAKGDPDKTMRALRKLTGAGKHLIMFNPAWHSTNMIGRFALLTASHPVAVAQALLKARGMRELNPEQAQEWWDSMEHEAIEHGLLPPQLNEDVVAQSGRHHMLASGDVETGTPLDVKTPVAGYKAAAADAVGAVKGADAWWQTHVNAHMWNQIHQFSVLSYIALKDDAVHRGMGPGDARLFAASQANSWAGMVSPDRWMNSPTMYNLSQLLLFAPNWWRTFPRIILNSYDRMGMKSNPALTHAWALNTAKTVGMMILLKGASDNLINWAMSGHWQFQNPDGYKNQITMDRFAAPDPNTGAHTVMENPFERQVSDLEKALGVSEAMKYGNWHPEFAGQGMAEVVAARASPLMQALETASNLDIYNTIKQRALRWVDPQHPYAQFPLVPTTSPQAAIAGLLNFSPMGYTAQAGLAGATATPQTLTWGPFAGTQIPGWAARAFDPNDPLVPLLSLIGVRGGYPAPVRSEGRGLSSDEQTQLVAYQNDWNTALGKQQTAVMSGGETWADFAYWYRNNAAAHANKVQGLVGGTSEYMQGAEGLLTRYEAVYNDPKAFDVNGDINWAYIQRAQDQMQAQTDPATWRQMVSLKDKREMQYPILRVYKDSLRNYHNFQNTEAQRLGIDGETLRSLIAQGASAPDFRRFEGQHPELARYYQAKRQWELETKQGFAYGLFTNNSYVMRVLAPSGDIKQVEAAEQQILPQIEASEAAGTFVTESGG